MIFFYLVAELVVFYAKIVLGYKIVVVPVFFAYTVVFAFFT